MRAATSRWRVARYYLARQPKLAAAKTVRYRIVVVFQLAIRGDGYCLFPVVGHRMKTLHLTQRSATNDGSIFTCTRRFPLPAPRRYLDVAQPPTPSHRRDRSFRQHSLLVRSRQVNNTRPGQIASVCSLDQSPAVSRTAAADHHSSYRFWCAGCNPLRWFAARFSTG